ncbi:MAG: NADH:ubiquinone reductase (Na(+)-transporting) subunit B [Alphaproteobacteria bacterium]
MGLRNFFDNIAPNFEKGGKYEKYYALFEMVETFCYTPRTVTSVAPHARDYIDTKRVMTYVVLATIPALLFGLYNTGLQSNNALVAMGMTEMDGLRGWVLSLIGYNYDPASIMGNILLGLTYWLPIYITTLLIGGIVEVVFALIRGHEVTEGFLVTSMLFSLTLPATIPLWQVALGISFGVIFGKEIFGGQGKNFMNPALVGRAFLYFAYPAQISGNAVWVGVDGFSGATALNVGAMGGLEAITSAGITLQDAFIGTIAGSIGETSTLAILLGLAFLLFTKIANYRLVAGCVIGMIGTTLLLNWVGSETNPMFNLPWYWHFVIGGYAFGLVFMVTEPISGAMTNKGRWIYGGLIGFMVILIRVVNPAFPEGMMMAILFGNIFAPLIDYFVVQSNYKRRVKRDV